MSRKIIFLSYRRGDSPGYVSMLENGLEQAFGENSVFRDVRDISGGTEWRQVIDKNLGNAAVLLLVIGPRWDRIWRERSREEVDHVELELERARELGVPVVPVTLDGATIAADTDLRSVAWLRDIQIYDISDRQQRWRGDFELLVDNLAKHEGLKRVKEKVPPSRFKIIAGTLAAVIVALGVIGYFAEEEPGTSGGGETAKQLMETPSVAQETGSAAAMTVETFPDITGAWRGEDGTEYLVTQYNDGSLDIFSPDYTSGSGRFFDNMPNKFEFELQGVGRGEMSVSASGDRLQGWMIDVYGQTVYDTLIRVPE